MIADALELFTRLDVEILYSLYTKRRNAFHKRLRSRPNTTIAEGLANAQIWSDVCMDMYQSLLISVTEGMRRQAELIRQSNEQFEAQTTPILNEYKKLVQEVTERGENSFSEDQLSFVRMQGDLLNSRHALAGQEFDINSDISSISVHLTALMTARMYVSLKSIFGSNRSRAVINVFLKSMKTIIIDLTGYGLFISALEIMRDEVASESSRLSEASKLLDDLDLYISLAITWCMMAQIAIEVCEGSRLELLATDGGEISLPEEDLRRLTEAVGGRYAAIVQRYQQKAPLTGATGAAPT